MDHLAFSGGERRGSHFLPGRLKGSPFTVFQVMLGFLLFTAHSAHQVLSSERNLSYIEEIRPDRGPIWNESHKKSERKCLDFHDNRFPELFYYWPEDNPLFHHCCLNPATFFIYNNKTGDYDFPQNLTFRYSQDGEELSYALYRDVGYFDQCLPFWRCRKTYQAIFHNLIFTAICEKTDMTRLYWNRFWGLLVWKYSFLETVLPWIPILEVIVILLAVGFFPLTWLLAGESPSTKASGWEHLVPTAKIWIKSIWKRLLMDWGHMFLLAIVGNGLVESMRRQSVFSMQSTVFFAYSMLYFKLFVILSCASVMQQLAYWIGSATEPKMLNFRPGKGLREEQDEPASVKPNVQATSDANAQGNCHIRKPKVTFAKSLPKISGTVDIELSDSVQNTDYGDASDGNHSDTEDAQRCILGDTKPAASDSTSHQNDDSTSHQNDGSTSHQNDPPKLLRWCCFQRSTATTSSRLSKKLNRSVRRYLSLHVFKMGDDYKWQPIATQAAIAFALLSFLTFAVDDVSEASDLFGIMLGYLVQAGCLWTGIYTVLVFFQRAAYVFRFFMKLRNHTNRSRNKSHFLEFQGPYHMHPV